MRERHSVGWLVIVMAVCGMSSPTFSAEPGSRPEERFEFSSYEQVQVLFDKLEYTPEAWQAGIREIPRVYLTEIASRWRDTVSKEVTVQTKKRIFFRALAPLALRSNELILRDRSRLVELGKQLTASGQLGGDDHAWLVQAGGSLWGREGRGRRHRQQGP